MIRVNLTVSLTSDSHWFHLGPTGLSGTTNDDLQEGIRYEIDNKKARRYMWNHPTIAAEHLLTKWEERR